MCTRIGQRCGHHSLNATSRVEILVEFFSPCLFELGGYLTEGVDAVSRDRSPINTRTHVPTHARKHSYIHRIWCTEQTILAVRSFSILTVFNDLVVCFFFRYFLVEICTV